MVVQRAVSPGVGVELMQRLDKGGAAPSNKQSRGGIAVFHAVYRAPDGGGGGNDL